MTIAWKKYQQDAAAVFRRLGLKAEVEQLIVGACGKHKVDVFVTGKFAGLDVKWVVECKAWRSNISKEKVAALIAIVQDVGSDKGVLLSEKGFQSGAVLMARTKNVVLTSIADLSKQISTDFAESIIARLEWRLNRVKERLWKLHKSTGEFFPTPYLTEQAKLFLLDLAFADALKGKFPIVYCIEDKRKNRLKATSLDDLVGKSNLLLNAAEAYCDSAESKVRRAGRSVKR
jgi:hypothetical protein